MSNSWLEAAVRHGPCVLMAKYASPSDSGFCPIELSCGASDVAPMYFRSADLSSGKETQPLVTVVLQSGSRPLLACSSKPATVERTASAPEPWLTCRPVSGSRAVWTLPPGMVMTLGCVIFEAGRGAAYAGTRSVGAVWLESCTKPL